MDPGNRVTLGNYEVEQESAMAKLETLKKFKPIVAVPDFLLQSLKLAKIGKNEEAFLIAHDDSVYVMGENKHCRLGLPPQQQKIGKPTLNPVLTDLEIIGIQSGKHHCLAWTKHGELYSWGKNESCQLGLSHGQAVSEPKRVFGALGKEKVVKAVGGATHTLCLTARGKVFAWGDNKHSQVGSKAWHECLPKEVEFPSGISRITDIFCTMWTSYALTHDGDVYAWGYGGYGELGNGRTGNSEIPLKINFPNNIHIVKVATGYDHCMALGSDRNAYTWGRNVHGQIGNGNGRSTLRPFFINLGAGGLLPTAEQFLVLDIASVNLSRISVCRTAVHTYVWGKFKGKEWRAPTIVEHVTRLEEVFAEDNRGMADNCVIVDRRQQMELDLKALYMTSTDVVFEVDGRQIQGCKFLLRRCKDLDEKFNNDWKNFPPSTPIKIEGFGYMEFGAFIKFLHTDEIDADIEDNHLIELLKLADYYDMKSLRSRAARLIEKLINVENAVSLYALAMKCKAERLRWSLVSFIGSKLAEIGKQSNLLPEYKDPLAQLMIDLKSNNLLTHLRSN